MARFSSRISWSLEPSLLAQALRAEARPAFDLTVSNPTEADLAYPGEQILGALADERALQYRPESLGLLTAREAVSEYYDGAVEPERIALTASTSEAYSWTFKMLCDPGDAILVPRPSYPLFEFLAHLESVEVRQYPMHYHHGWYIDLDALESMIDARTRAIVFVNPNNPTGSWLKLHEYEALANLCSRHDLTLIVDEVFADYGLAPLPSNALRTVAGRNDVLTIRLSGLSKISALPQMKLGWLAVQGPQAEREAAMQRLELIADTFLSSSAPVQCAAAELLGMRHRLQEQIVERTRSNYCHLQRLAQDSAARVLHAEGGWCAIVQAPRIRTEDEWVLHLLREHEVLVQPGYFYDFEAEPYLVLSTLTPPQVFVEGARRTILACKG